MGHMMRGGTEAAEHPSDDRLYARDMVCLYSNVLHANSSSNAMAVRPPVLPPS